MGAMTSSRRSIGGFAAMALVAGSIGLVALPDDPAKANGGGLSGPPVYAIVGTLTGCNGPLGMTVVRNGVADDTVYVACAFDGNIAYITDDSVNGSVSGLIGVGFSPTLYPVGVESAGDDTTTQSDDTVYVGYGPPNTVASDAIGAIPPGTTSGTVDDSTVLNVYAYYSAVSRDDTVYLAFDDTMISINDGDDTLGVFNPGTAFTSGDTLDDSFTLPATFGLVTFDDTLFTFGYPTNASGVGAVNMTSPSLPTLDDSLTLAQGFWLPIQMAVSDDTLYVPTLTGDDTSLGSSGILWSINPIDLSVDDSLSIPVRPNEFAPWGLATNPQGTLIARGASYARIIDGRTMNLKGPEIVVPFGLDDSYYGPSQAMTRSGVAYVGSTDQGVISRIAEVTPQLNASAGAVGATVQFTLNPSAADVTVDDSAVMHVFFGNAVVLGSDMVRSGNTFTFAVPEGCGAVPVVPVLAGQIAIEIGAWTYPACPTPTPSIPSGPPTSVTAVAGDASATVSWTAPTSQGSFGITQYEVIGNPAGSCLVNAPVTTCDVTGLTNGTEYTFTARALSGAGWGAYSTPSNPVTPQGPTPPPVPSIVIVGTRGEVRGKPGVIVTGQTSGLSEGTALVPWFRFPGQTSYTSGTARPKVDAEGGVQWQRRTGKRIYVSLRTLDGSTRSNRVIVQPAAGVTVAVAGDVANWPLVSESPGAGPRGYPIAMPALSAR